jgi:lipoprotein signal peptidase
MSSDNTWSNNLVVKTAFLLVTVLMAPTTLLNSSLCPIDLVEPILTSHSDADAYCNRGAAYGRSGNYNDAISDYTRAIIIGLFVALANMWI